MATKQRPVVIGNGMAGARFLEEIVAMGGRDLFDVVVFGDEPYGNYNRILLSGVLAGTHDPKDILINPLSWYQENGITLHACVKAGWIDRASKRVYAPGGVGETYDKLVIATGSLPFVPPMDGLYREDGKFKEGVFVFRTLDDCSAITEYASHSKKVGVIGGGLLLVGLLLGTAGASFAVALPLASRWYGAQRQRLVMGIAAAGNSGTVVANLLAPRLAAVVG